MASSREVLENDSSSSEESLNSSMTSESDQEEKTVREILSSLNDEEVSELLKNKEKLKVLYNSLLKCMRNSERELEIRRLREIIEKVAKGSKHLQKLIVDFLQQRRKLLEILKEYANKIEVITKLCNAGKLASSIIDCVGLIGSSVIKRTNSSELSFYVNTVFQTANVAGLLGFGLSATEFVIWKTALEDLMKEIQIDQDFFAPIQEWFQQNNELEQAMQAIIPFKITAFLVKEFEKSIEREVGDFELFQTILAAVLKEDRERIRNATLIQNLMDFISCPAARHWCRWIFLRNRKVTLDVANMLLHLNTPQQSVSSQSVGTLTRFGSNSESSAFWGRVVLNCWSIYNAIYTLRNGEMVNEMRKLEKHLRQEMESLIQIEKNIRRRRSS